MYKQQSYDTPTEEFFQPSEGKFSIDYVKILLDSISNYKCVPEKTIKNWLTKSKKSAQRNRVCIYINECLNTFIEEIRNQGSISQEDVITIDDKKIPEKIVVISSEHGIEILVTNLGSSTGQNTFFGEMVRNKEKYDNLIIKTKVDSEFTTRFRVFTAKKDNYSIHITIKNNKDSIDAIYRFRDKNDQTVFDSRSEEKINIKLAMKWLELKGFKNGENMDAVCKVYKEEADQTKKDLTEARTQLTKAQKELEATTKYFLHQTKVINKEKNELEVTLVGVREQLESADEKTEEVDGALDLIYKIIDKGNKIIIKNEEKEQKENQNIEQTLKQQMNDAVVKKIEDQFRQDQQNQAQAMLAIQKQQKQKLSKRIAERAKKKNKQPDEPSDKQKQIADLQAQIEELKQR